VAHQVVNRSFIAAAMNVERHKARRIRQSNTAINVFDYTHDDGDLMAVTVNGDFHLRDVAPV
ncbi:histidine phosphatase family protein, partial [bacterium]|nr:histidine phosphatase family protein [bacterium]